MNYDVLRKDKCPRDGFTLIELIVVIAIMAVLLAVLAPSLLRYMEDSRMQRDDSAMDEVVEAIQIAAAYPEVYEHPTIIT